MIQQKSKYLHMHTLLRFLFHFFRRQLVQQPNSISFAIVVILRNEVGWFYEEENYSSLVAARRATDAAYVQPAIAERISVILQNITSLLTSFFVGFIIERRVALLILVTFPLLVLGNYFIKFCLGQGPVVNRSKYENDDLTGNLFRIRQISGLNNILLYPIKLLQCIVQNILSVFHTKTK